MAAEVLLNTELSLCLYKAVSEKDYKRIVFLYADIARKAVICNSRWTPTTTTAAVGSSSRSSNGKPSSLNEEKVDEFFGSGNSNSISRGNSRGAVASAPYNLMVMEELDSIMEMALSWSNMEEDQDHYQHMNSEHDSGDEDKKMSSSSSWQQAQQSRRNRKSHHNMSYSNNSSSSGRRDGSIGPVLYPFQEEVSMCSAAKALSNTRAPPSFVLYSNNHAEFDADDIEEDDDRTSATPLFDGSAAGSGGTLLHLACIVDAPLALALLLALGGDPTGRHSAFRRLPVHEACCSDSQQCLALLLHLAADSLQHHSHDQTHDMTIDKDEQHHYSDMHNFCSGVAGGDGNGSSFTQILRLFLSLVDDSRETVGWNELDAAKTLLSQVSLPLSTRSALLSFSPTSSTPDGHGNTPLHWASFKNAKSCVSLLLSAGSDPNAKAHPSGWTPLHDASYSNASSSLALLLQAGAYVDARASSGATPLCFAAQEDAPDSAQLLLEAGASTTIRCCGTAAILNVVNGALQPPPPQQPSSRFSGYTPLHYCAHYNASNSARLILIHDADNIIHIPDLSNKLPIHVAVIRGSDTVLRLLFSFGAALPPSLPQFIPKKPVQSTKPWNCLTQERISKCVYLLQEASQEWTMSRHYLFSHVDKSCINTILHIAKRWEQYHYGIYLKEVWLEVLSFISRGWFEPKSHSTSRHFSAPNTTSSHYATHYYLGSNGTARRPSMNTDDNNDDMLVDYDLDNEDEQEEETDLYNGA